jgi:hypothetical protein
MVKASDSPAASCRGTRRGTCSAADISHRERRDNWGGQRGRPLVLEADVELLGTRRGKGPRGSLSAQGEARQP